MRFRRILCVATLLARVMTALPMPGGTARAAAGYYISIDLTNQIVTVYDNGNTTDSGIARQMICSSGASGTSTPVGTYTLPKKSYSSERTEWYYFPKYSCYAKWATRIVGGILFHSVLYTSAKKGPTSSSVRALGRPASHGCIRLRVADAKWIALNCPAGTKCRIYKSGKTNADLRKRLLNKSFSRSEGSYDAFMGRAADLDKPYVTLYKGIRGTRVTKLQQRLTALGFLDDVADGIFGAKTETAVKRFQAAAKVKKTGTVPKALWNAIFDDDAPTGTCVPLSEGMEGPAVAALQGALIRLKLLEGTASGSYDEETADAVAQYQACFTGGEETGEAGCALQDDALERADSVAAQFDGEEYRLVLTTVDQAKAKIKGASKVTLRAKAKNSAKSLAKLKKKTVVDVLEQNATWSKVQYKDKVGFIKNKYLSPFTETATVAAYESAVAPTATPEILIPTATPAPSATPEVFIPTPTPEIFIPTPTPEPTATPAPSASPAWDWTFVLGPDGDRVSADAPEAVARESEADVGEVAMALTGDNTHAPAYALAARDDTPLYALPDAESAVLAALAEGEALPVLRVEEGWVTVLYREGAACLRLEDARLADAGSAVEYGDEADPGATEPGAEANGLEIEAEPVAREDDEVALEPEME